ncbi:MAG: hypothetical protein U0175_07910 [Caldilineaceae bacterium]
MHEYILCIALSQTPGSDQACCRHGVQRSDVVNVCQLANCLIRTDEYAFPAGGSLIRTDEPACPRGNGFIRPPQRFCQVEEGFIRTDEWDRRQRNGFSRTDEGLSPSGHFIRPYR